MAEASSFGRKIVPTGRVTGVIDLTRVYVYYSSLFEGDCKNLPVSVVSSWATGVVRGACHVFKVLSLTVLPWRLYSDGLKTSEAVGLTLWSACLDEGECVPRDSKNLLLIIFRSFAFTFCGLRV